MPTIRSRLLDERTHPLLRYLLAAQRREAGDPLILRFKTPNEAAAMRNALNYFRSKGKIGAPGDYDITHLDPKGEGKALFDNISISLKIYVDKGEFNSSQGECLVVLKRVPTGQSGKHGEFPVPLNEADLFPVTS